MFHHCEQKLKNKRSGGLETRLRERERVRERERERERERFIVHQSAHTKP